MPISVVKPFNLQQHRPRRNKTSLQALLSSATNTTVKNKTKKGAGHLLGVGFDNKDGHKRITQAEKFFILGGSEETHGNMTETVIKTFETIKNQGKILEQIDVDELADILHKNTPS